MTRLGADTNPHPSTMSGWQVEASPANAGSEHPSTVRIFGRTSSRSHLTAAGLVAIAAQMSTYLSVAKCGAVQARAGVATGCEVTSIRFWVDVLPEDGPTQIAALCALLQAPANVTAA